MTNTIYFYKAKDEYGCFSNFSPHGFELEGKWYPTSEHYYQAQKFITTDKELSETIIQAKTPLETAKIGRNISHPLRQDWEKVKDKIMLKGVLKKFTIHKDIQKILLDTGDDLIVENSPTDYYWGCGADGTGKNQLGLTLIKVRMLLRQSIRMDA
jgi:ribA/ribD-fused uncharacterized protein